MRRTRLENLVAVCDRFGKSLEGIPDSTARSLHDVYADLSARMIEVRARNPEVRSSEFASGIEQGLREAPESFSAVSAQWRETVEKAFYAAFRAEYPEFMAKEAARLEKVETRGRIRTDSEYYLVRHQVDALEGDEDALARLHTLYAMLEAYELRSS
ncbi:hypothetical protein [Alkalisalibacterium limincola]|uniref:Uncharacterized protein n=1 Tax=Alkalisalibacterium limincola TaxID=2699169 RepID=A0A5C8KIV2_9GAMM|nr:hypothetical protein [Alkalisalibacterium limincola]TXK59046.1 hypothetical protein FU658_14175 [Alkalisalibacterium limincola]